MVGPLSTVSLALCVCVCDVTAATAVTHTVGHCTGDGKGSIEEKKHRSNRNKPNRLLLRVQPDDTLGSGTKFYKDSRTGTLIGTTSGGRLELAAMSFDSRAWNFFNQVCP